MSGEIRKKAEGFFSLVALAVRSQVVPHVTKGTYAFSTKLWSFTGLRTDEELHARAIKLEAPECVLDSDQSWDLVNAARVEGSDWLSASNDVSIDEVDALFDECDVRLQQDFEHARVNRDNENRDRIDFQINRATQHRDRLLESESALLERYREQRNSNLIRMTEGRINAIERKFDVQLEGFRQKREINATSEEVCYGIIRVGAV